jgi:5-formyltetrahydrofolate cyclo-ligase
MKDSNNKKKELRANLLLKRRNLDQDIIAAQSDNMAKQLFVWPYYQQAQIIMLFLSMADEPQMMKVIEDAWLQGKTICVPYMRHQYGVMDAAIIDNLDSLVRGRLNLLVPDPATVKLVDPKVIDLMIVPGVAYDYSGNRLGMGAGYYDRFIPRAPQAILIGASWSSHVLESIPYTYYDKPVHYLLNENRIIKCDRRKR